MAVEALTAFPSSFVAGDTVRVTFSESDYPSSSWSLSVNFRGATLASFAAQAGVSNTFDLVIAASATAALTAGTYAVTFVYIETASSERATINFGNVEVLPNPTAATVKSVARQTLEAMETAMLSLAAGSHQTVNFNGQSFTKKNLKEFQEAIAVQRGIVAAEDGKIALNSGNRRSDGIHIRFA